MNNFYAISVSSKKEAKEVQRLLFSHGYNWKSGTQKMINTIYGSSLYIVFNRTHNRLSLVNYNYYMQLYKKAGYRWQGGFLALSALPKYLIDFNKKPKELLQDFLNKLYE